MRREPSAPRVAATHVVVWLSTQLASAGFSDELSSFAGMVRGRQYLHFHRGRLQHSCGSPWQLARRPAAISVRVVYGFVVSTSGPMSAVRWHPRFGGCWFISSIVDHWRRLHWPRPVSLASRNRPIHRSIVLNCGPVLASSRRACVSGHTVNLRYMLTSSLADGFRPGCFVLRWRH